MSQSDQRLKDCSAKKCRRRDDTAHRQDHDPSLDDASEVNKTREVHTEGEDEDQQPCLPSANPLPQPCAAANPPCRSRNNHNTEASRQQLPSPVSRPSQVTSKIQDHRLTSILHRPQEGPPNQQASPQRQASESRHRGHGPGWPALRRAAGRDPGQPGGPVVGAGPARDGRDRQLPQADAAAVAVRRRLRPAGPERTRDEAVAAAQEAQEGHPGPVGVQPAGQLQGICLSSLPILPSHTIPPVEQS